MFQKFCMTWQGINYYIGVELYTFFISAVLSPLPSIFSVLLEDSLFWSSFPASEYLRSTLEDSCSTPLRTLYFSGTSPAFECVRSTLEDST